MKDARFKELLNLHLDHRLSPADAEELEAELRADPARRKALRDYEAMQSACAALFARSEAHAPSSSSLHRALRQAEDRIEHPRSTRDAWGWPTWGLTGGLAACIALVVARLSQPALSTAQTPAQPLAETEGRLVLAAMDTTRLAPAPAARVATPSQLTFAALGLSPSGTNADAVSRWILQIDEPAMYATVDQATKAGEALQAWSGNDGVSPATVQSAHTVGHFSGRPINAWGQNQVSAGGGFQAEATAYRFER
jgi:hypothetical protein